MVREKGNFYTLGLAIIGAFMIYRLTRPDTTVLSTLHGTDSEKAAMIMMPDAPKSSITFEDLKDNPQDDPRLIQYLRSIVIHRPAKGPYKLNKPELRDFSQFGQPLIANDLVFHGKKNGFFIEVGALDGELYSNSLFYERELGWNGLLIEPNYDTYTQLIRKKRKCYSVHGALSPQKSPKELLFINHGFAGAQSAVSKNEMGMKVKAYPLYSLLLAINVTTIDFFSLDVEGQEVKVLETLPLDKIKIMVLCVEKTQVPLESITKLLTPFGYKCIGIMDNDGWYVHRDIWKEGMRV